MYQNRENDEQNQSQGGRLCSSFHSIQEKSGTLFHYINI